MFSSRNAADFNAADFFLYILNEVISVLLAMNMLEQLDSCIKSIFSFWRIELLNTIIEEKSKQVRISEKTTVDTIISYFWRIHTVSQ